MCFILWFFEHCEFISIFIQFKIVCFMISCPEVYNRYSQFHPFPRYWWTGRFPRVQIGTKRAIPKKLKYEYNFFVLLVSPLYSNIYIEYIYIYALSFKSDIGNGKKDKERWQLFLRNW